MTRLLIHQRRNHHATECSAFPRLCIVFLALLWLLLNAAQAQTSAKLKLDENDYFTSGFFTENNSTNFILGANATATAGTQWNWSRVSKTGSALNDIEGRSLLSLSTGVSQTSVLDIAGSGSFAGFLLRGTFSGTNKFTINYQGNVVAAGTITGTTITGTTFSGSGSGLTGVPVASVTGITAAAQTVLDDTTTAAMLTTLSAAGTGLANTFSQSQTFNGTNNTAPNQSKWASASSTLMTRNARAWEDLVTDHKTRRVNPADADFAFTGTGAAATGAGVTGYAFLNSGTSVGCYARGDFMEAVTGNTSGSGAGITFSRPIAVSTLFTVVPNAGNALRLTVGRDTGVAPTFSDQNALTARGFGWSLYYDSASSTTKIKLFRHDGTTYAESSAVTFGNFANLHHVILEHDGAGNLALYASAGTPPSRVSSTAIATLTGAPTSSGAITNRAITMASVGHSSTTSTGSLARVISMTALIE